MWPALSPSSRRCVVAFGAVLLCAGFFLTGCQRRPEPQPGFSVEHEITPHPPRVGTATVTLRVADATGTPVSGARVHLEGNMTHAGMRPVFGEATELAPGRYQSTLEFTMGGDWVVLVRLTLPDGREIERELNVKGVKSD
jgi:hypothetical protein